MEVILICATVLIAVAGVLFFLDRHMTMTKKWRADFVAYIENRVSHELALHKERIVETLQRSRADTETIDKKFKDLGDSLIVLNQNQTSIATEINTMKNLQGIRGSNADTGLRSVRDIINNQKQ